MSTASGKSGIARQLIQRRHEKMHALAIAHQDRERDECGILRVLINVARTRLDENKKSIAALSLENQDLSAKIELLEGTTMTRVAGLLGKHHKFAVAAAAMRSKGEAEEAVEEMSYDNRMAAMKAETAVLHRACANAQGKIKETTLNITALNSYQGDQAEILARRFLSLRAKVDQDLDEQALEIQKEEKKFDQCVKFILDKRNQNRTKAIAMATEVAIFPVV